MFGDLIGKMEEAREKMEEAREKMEETKLRMGSVYVNGEAEGGLVKVTASANKRIKEVEIADDIANDKEAIEELLVVALNRALERADEVSDAEMQKVASQYMGGMPGLGGF